MDSPEAESEAEAGVGEFAAEKQEALRLLLDTVEGEVTPEDLASRYEAADPVLVYFLFKWIRKHYHRDHEDSEFVRGNLKDLTNSFRSLTRKAKGGEDDPLVEWFEGNYRYNELPAEEFIDLIVEKLEG